MYGLFYKLYINDQNPANILLVSSLDKNLLETIKEQIKFYRNTDGCQLNNVLKITGYYDDYYRLYNLMDKRYQERNEVFDSRSIRPKDAKWQSVKSKYNNAKNDFDLFCEFIQPSIQEEIENQMSKFNSISFELYEKIERCSELIVEELVVI